MEMIELTENFSLGAIPSKPDRRDYTVSMFTQVGTSFPAEFTITNVPKIYDQGQYGMCVAFSCAAIKESQEYKERGVQKRYSPGFIYANRKDGDYLGEGMEPREALKNLVADGVTEYTAFPKVGTYSYLSSEFKQYQTQLLPLAKPQVISSYVAIYSEDEVKTALMSWGPVLFCIAVYDSFYRPVGGVVPQVKDGETVRGYHALTCVGWKVINGKTHYIINNSWSTSWGVNGQCFIPTDYKGISEMWSVTDYTPLNNVRELKMAIPMQVLPPGTSVVPVRSVYEPIGGIVQWGNETGTVWVEVTIPPYSKPRVVRFEQGSDKITIRE